MSNNQVITAPRDEVERLVKLLQYQAHPYPSPHAAFWQRLLDKPVSAKSVQRFWSCEAKNIRCVRESDYDALEQRLINADAGLLHERSPKDYAIEHAEYMATSADHVLTEFQRYGLALLAVDEGGDEGEGELFDAVDSARQDLQEALVTLRSRTYEFRKRQARAITL
ncbi:hypothetical protein [Pseudomonas brenneri]|uniref:hypothetical protein n=1 Tax=Pseudomonas brenneri TaxID=129817 RepID=UPI003BA28AF2